MEKSNMETLLQEVKMSTQYKLHVSIPIKDGDPTVNTYGSGVFTPTLLIIEYRKLNNSTVQTNVILHGYKVKKNGELSSVKGSHSWWTTTQKPEWVNELVEKYWPDF